MSNKKSTPESNNSPQIDLSEWMAWEPPDSSADGDSVQIDPASAVWANPDDILIFSKNGENAYQVALKRKSLPESYFRVEIPARYNGKAVNAISDNAFTHCDKLLMAIIPDSVKKIGDAAFKDCTSLGYMDDLVIPSGVISIGDGAFRGCTDLEAIVLPAEMTGIGEGAFEGCDSLRSVTIPQGLRAISREMFSNCGRLNSVTIPNSIRAIEWGAFWNCDSLYEINIPEGVEIIGSMAFNGCDSLDDVVLPDSLKKIESSAFGVGTGQSTPRQFSISKNTVVEDDAFEDYNELTKLIVRTR